VALLGLIGAAGVAAAQAAAGKLQVEITANGEPAAGKIELLPAGGGNPVASGDAGTTLDVPAGTWDVKATLTAAIDRPSRTEPGVVVGPGGPAVVRVEFSVARATFVCRRGDTAVGGHVRLRRPGAAWLPAVRCDEPFVVSGGAYEAELTVDGGGPTVAVPRVQLMAGATQRRQLDVP